MRCGANELPLLMIEIFVAAGFDLSSAGVGRHALQGMDHVLHGWTRCGNEVFAADECLSSAESNRCSAVGDSH